MTFKSDVSLKARPIRATRFPSDLKKRVARTAKTRTIWDLEIRN